MAWRHIAFEMPVDGQKGMEPTDSKMLRRYRLEPGQLGCDNGRMTNSPHLRQTRRSLPIALLRAREVVMEPIRGMLATSGVNEQKWRVLRALQESGPLELTNLAQEACLLLPSLTRMVRPMADEGLVFRTTPEEDRRKVVLAITPVGEALILSHSAKSNAIFDAIERQFGKENLEQLLDLLEDLRKLELLVEDKG